MRQDQGPSYQVDGHHPDVEEYPVMATTSVGFRLTPDGFFPRNPALDVPLEPEVTANP